MKQNGTTKDMIFNIPTLIEYVSSIMKLEKGDLILTGEYRFYYSKKHLS
jgi:acylpyruvate hydrolase